MYLDNDLPTIFHITHWKAGSQWIYQLLAGWQPNRTIAPLTLNAQLLGQPILPGMIYPTVYSTRDEFETLTLPENSIKFVVIRDLRDTLISDYFSSRYSHVNTHSRDAQRLRIAYEQYSLSDGLHLAMCKLLPNIAAIQKSWSRSNSVIYRYEDFIQDEYEQFSRLFQYCRADLTAQQLRSLITAFSFETRAGRSRGSEDIHSHYRKGVAGDWKNYLKGNLLVEFKELYDDTLIETGYETSRDWGLAEIPRLYPVHNQIQAASEGFQPLLQCWCSSVNLAPFSPDFNQCSVCGSLVRKNLISPDKLFGIDGTEAHYSPYVGEVNVAEYARYKYSNDVILTVLRTLKTYKQPNARILDVTASTGTLVALASAAGYEAIGIGAVSSTAEYAQRLNIPISMQTIDNREFPAGSFDAIVLMDSVGKFPDPIALLSGCMELLAEDGILVLATQLFNDTRSYDQLEASGAQSLITLHSIPRLYMFTSTAYQMLLDKAGFLWTSTLFVDSSDLFNADYHYITVAARKVIPELAPGNIPEVMSIEGQMVSALLDLQQRLQSKHMQTIENKNLAFAQLQRVLSQPPNQALQDNLLTTGNGWHQVENYQNETFCWIDNDAEIIIRRANGHEINFELEVEPGPGVGSKPFELQMLNQQEKPVETVQVNGREVVQIKLPLIPNETMIYRMHVDGGGSPTPNDPRILNFRVFRFGLSSIS